MRDKERDGQRADGQSNWRKEEETESERTKCNLSAHSDSQCLKWELTESVEDCSLIGQGQSWHFQAKLQWQWLERMCYNYKLFPLPPFRAASEAQRLFLIFYPCLHYLSSQTVLSSLPAQTERAIPRSVMNRNTNMYLCYSLSFSLWLGHSTSVGDFKD